ncbi:MAG: hypothetical protein CSA75_01155, partial [Sorangium cellulosum]
LAEVQATAEQMKWEATTIAPTLLRHVGPNAFRASMRETLAGALPIASQSPPSSHTLVRLLRYDRDALERIVLALAYDTTFEFHAEARLASLKKLNASELAQIVTKSLSHRGEHDPAPRAFESSSVTLELDLDYGAYRDLQRHRMLTPSTQLLSCSLGAMLPDDVDSLGVRAAYQAALDQAAEVWSELEKVDPFAAQYVVPLAFRVRTLWTLNLRQLFYVVELRSARQGHANYRRVAQEIYRQVCTVHPWLKDLIRVDLQDHRLART